MTLERKRLIEKSVEIQQKSRELRHQTESISAASRGIQQKSRDLKKKTETTFAATQRTVERARELARIVKTKIHKNAMAMKKAS
jgi:hypothetical protein